MKKHFILGETAIGIWKTLLRINFILTSFITIVLKIPISSNCVVAPEIHIIKCKKEIKGNHWCGIFVFANHDKVTLESRQDVAENYLPTTA